MLNCKQVSELVSESLDKKPGFWTRMNLWMHLCMCGLCWKFRKTVLRVHDEARQIGQDLPEPDSGEQPNLSPESRHRIRELIQRNR